MYTNTNFVKFNQLILDPSPAQLCGHPCQSFFLTVRYVSLLVWVTSDPINMQFHSVSRSVLCQSKHGFPLGKHSQPAILRVREASSGGTSPLRPVRSYMAMHNSASHQNLLLPWSHNYLSTFRQDNVAKSWQNFVQNVTNSRVDK